MNGTLDYSEAATQERPPSQLKKQADRLGLSEKNRNWSEHLVPPAVPDVALGIPVYGWPVLSDAVDVYSQDLIYDAVDLAEDFLRTAEVVEDHWFLMAQRDQRAVARFNDIIDELPRVAVS